MSDLPPLPKGFVLDDGQQADVTPPLPSGFTLDAPQPSFGSQMKSAITDIPSEIYSAAASAVSTIGDNLNPFSPVRQAATEQRSKQPFFSLQGMKDQADSMAGVGSGLAAIPALAASPIQGTGRSVIGHTMAAITPGTDYEQGKEIADRAMMAMRPAGKFSTQQGGGVAFTPPTLPAITPLAADAKAAASAAYKSPEVTDLEIHPQSVATLSAKIENDLTRKGYRPKSADGAFSEVQGLVPGPGVTSVRVADLDSARQALGVYAKEVNSVGKPTANAAAASIAIKHIDEYLPNIPATDVIAGDPLAAQSALRSARGNWAAGSRGQEVDFRLSQAERQAAKSGSGSNIENAMRQKIDKVSEYGLTAEEKALRDKIVLGDWKRNGLRKAGKLGVDGGLSLMLHAAAGIGSGGMTLPITAAGTMARKAGEFLTKREIALLNKMIRDRSPLAQSMPPRQMPPPSPLLGSILPYGLMQRLPMLMGAVPARADDDQQIGRWR